MSQFIQEVLGLIQRKKTVTTLNPAEDWFEFGRLTASTLNTGSSYKPKMAPYAIKYGELFCDLRKDLTITIKNSGVEGKLPVYTVKDGYCSLDALKDSIITQNAANTLITVDGSLTVTADSTLSGSVELGTSGDIVNATSLFNVIHDSTGTAAGTANRILRSLADGRVVWSDDDPVVTLTYGSIWRGSSTDVREELAIGAAGQVLTSDGTTANWSSSGSGTVTSVGFAAPSAFTVAGSPITSSGVITLSGAGTTLDYIDGTGALQTFPSIPSAVPIMSSTVLGIGKLWDDLIQAVPAVPVSATPDRTYGVQFNDAQQLVVNVPWVSGGGGGTTYTLTSIQSGTDAILTLTGSGGTTNDIRFIAGTNITLTDTGNSITIDAAGGVTSFTNANGTFISATQTNTGAAGTVTMGTIDLSASGIPSSTTFLRGDNSWATIPGGNPGTVTSVSSTTAGNALDVVVTNPTTTPDLAFTFAGSDAQYITGAGNLDVLPFVTLTTTGTSGAATLSSGVLNIPQYSGGSGTVTSVDGGTSTFVSIAGGPITAAGTLTASLSATGTPGAGNFLRGDNTWAVPPTVNPNWNLTGDVGPAYTIFNSNTVLISGGVGLTSTASALNTLTIDLNDTAVTPGAYTNTNVTVDQQGRITAIANGGSGATYDWSLFADTGDIDPVPLGGQVTIAGGTNVTTALVGNTLTINATQAAPAGANGNIQYNDNGAFGAESTFSYDSTNNTLNILGQISQPGIKLSNITASGAAGTQLAEIEAYYVNSEAGAIRFVADGTVGVGDVPTRLELYTTSDGSGTATKKATIKATGQLELAQYGAGTFTGTATKNLSVTATGQVIETEPAGVLTRPGATAVTYNVYSSTNNAYSVSVSSSTPGVPAQGQVIGQWQTSNLTENMQQFAVNMTNLSGGSLAAVWSNVSVGATLEFQFTPSGGGQAGPAYYRVTQVIDNSASGYMNFIVSWISGGVGETWVTKNILQFVVDSDYSQTLSAGYNRFNVNRTSSLGTQQDFILVPDSSLSAGSEVVVEINGSAGSNNFKLGYVKGEQIGNGTSRITNTVWIVDEAVLANISVTGGETYLMRFQVNMLTANNYKGLTFLGCDKVYGGI